MARNQGKHWEIKELGRPLTREEAFKMTRGEKLKIMEQRQLLASLYQHTRMDIRWGAFDEYLEAMEELSKTNWMSSFQG